MGSNSRLIDPQPQAWQHQGDGRLIGPLSTKGTGRASSCPGMGQQSRIPMPQYLRGMGHPSLVGDSVRMPCVFEEEGVAM